LIINDKNERVAVIGLGYVGLPLAIHLAERDVPVTGIDIDTGKVMKLLRGMSYIPDVSSAKIRQFTEEGKLDISLPTAAAIRQATHIIVTVPTPVNKRGNPDLKALIGATKYLSQHLAQGQTVIYESSTYPGTLEEELLPILTKGGRTVGEDFYAGYSPERIDPGNDAYPLHRIPKVISGATPFCLIQVERLYRRLFDKVVPVSSPRVAELCKLFENIQRLVNISLVNEMDVLCGQMNINFREALRAAATKPFGFTPYWPGPGIGGHCIPVDPLYFQWKAKQSGLTSTMIRTAHLVNRRMPKEVVRKAIECLATDGSADVKGKSALLVGVAYKKDVNDVRESPALDIFAQLLEQGCAVDYHDPHIPELTMSGMKWRSVSLSDEVVSNYDVVVILTDHSRMDWPMLQRAAKAVVDTRGVLREAWKGEGA
jgi:nucleotide sugar dehydrogenase